MANSTLDQVQRLVEQLSLLDQARLLAYLAPRIASVVASMPHVVPVSSQGPTEAWKEFCRLGEALAASDTPELETLTATVLAMRR